MIMVLMNLYFMYFQAYIREGSALQQLGQHADALAAFASGLANDAGNNQLLSGLTDAAIKCPLKGEFCSISAIPVFLIQSTFESIVGKVELGNSYPFPIYDTSASVDFETSRQY